MRNRALASQIAWLMAGTIVLTLAMVLDTLGWTAREHDRKDAQDTVHLVEGGFAAVVDSMTGLVTDHAIRDAALVESERESARIARTDSLTGVSNRLAFSESLGRRHRWAGGAVARRGDPAGRSGDVRGQEPAHGRADAL